MTFVYKVNTFSYLILTLRFLVQETREFMKTDKDQKQWVLCPVPANDQFMRHRGFKERVYC